jgi:hypothetical protein
MAKLVQRYRSICLSFRVYRESRSLGEVTRIERCAETSKPPEEKFQWIIGTGAGLQGFLLRFF